MKVQKIVDVDIGHIDYKLCELELEYTAYPVLLKVNVNLVYNGENIKNVIRKYSAEDIVRILVDRLNENKY